MVERLNAMVRVRFQRTGDPLTQGARDHVCAQKHCAQSVAHWLWSNHTMIQLCIILSSTDNTL